MAKNKKKINKEPGKRKPRESANQKKKRRNKQYERITAFNIKKTKEKALEDMKARESALERLGINDGFEFADHAKMYNTEHGKFHSAPILMIDASVPPAPITSYPERSPSPQAHHQPVPEDQLVPEEPAVVVALLERQATDAARARRSRAILEAHCGEGRNKLL